MLRRMRRGMVVLAVLVATLAAAPGALACAGGQVPAKVNGRAVCVAQRLAFPSPTHVAPATAQIQDALAVAQTGFTTRGGKRAVPLSKRARRSWASARPRLLKAVAATLTRVRRAAADPCAALDLLSPGALEDATGRPAARFTADGSDVSLTFSSQGAKLGIKTTVRGDTYTMKYESSELRCSKEALPRCPTAAGHLDQSGASGKVGFELTVQRGGKVVAQTAFHQLTTAQTKGQVADDAKLDGVDARYVETTIYSTDKARYTSRTTRVVRIDMRKGTYGPGTTSSASTTVTEDGTRSGGSGLDISERSFATFIGKTIDEYRARENAWQNPGTCAKLLLTPASSTLTVHRGATGTFSAQVVTAAGGEPAAKARWTLSAQQNGTFSPTESSAPAPSFSYTATTRPSGTTISATVRATSTAGVAQDPWTQKLDDPLRTISGTFTGHATERGVVYDWTGTATFTRTASDADFGGPGGIFLLTAGQAKVTVSGTDGECTLSGTSTIGLFGQSPWTLTGSAAPFSYQIVAPFLPDPPQATRSACSNPADDGGAAGLGSMFGSALQSGDITDLVRTTTDPTNYVGSAHADGPAPDQAQSWTWSFTGAP